MKMNAEQNQKDFECRRNTGSEHVFIRLHARELTYRHIDGYLDEALPAKASYIWISRYM